MSEAPHIGARMCTEPARALNSRAMMLSLHPSIQTPWRRFVPAHRSEIFNQGLAVVARVKDSVLPLAAALSLSPQSNRLLPISITLKVISITLEVPKSGKPDFGGGRGLGGGGVLQGQNSQMRTAMSLPIHGGDGLHQYFRQWLRKRWPRHSKP